MANEEVCKVISGAIQILETEGWTQNSYHNADGYCAVGALYKAAGYRDDGIDSLARYNEDNRDIIMKVLALVADNLPKSFPKSYAWGDITKYNDSLKTEKPIIDLFKRALESCK